MKYSVRFQAVYEFEAYGHHCVGFHLAMSVRSSLLNDLRGYLRHRLTILRLSYFTSCTCNSFFFVNEMKPNLLVLFLMNLAILVFLVVRLALRDSSLSKAYLLHQNRVTPSSTLRSLCDSLCISGLYWRDTVCTSRSTNRSR